MKKTIGIVTVLVTSFLSAFAQQKTVADCTVEFIVKAEGKNAATQQSIQNSIQTVFIKGNQTRVDVVSPDFKQTELFDGRNKTMVVLQEFGTNKYMRNLDATKLAEQNKMFADAALSFGTESKTILGYDCKKATLKLSNGKEYAMYYATAIAPSVKDYKFQFKDVPGFVLEYESNSNDGKSTITYTASSITLSPVPVSKFEIPKSGYRVL